MKQSTAKFDDYRLIFDSSVDAILLSDEDGNIVEANEAGLRMLGYERSILIGMNVTDIIDRHNLEIDPIRLDLHKTETPVRKERLLRLADGTSLPVEIIARRLREDRVFAMIRDISERKEKEREFKAAYHDIEQIWNTSVDGLRVVDKGFNVILFNRPFEKLSGMTPAEIRSKKCHEVFGGFPCQTTKCPLNRVLRGEKEIEYEVVKYNKEEHAIPCILRATPFRNQEGRIIGLVESFHDISDLKKKESLLLESQKNLRSLATKLILAEEEQRRDIANYLHDDTCQNIAFATMKLRAIGKKTEEPYHSMISDLTDLLDQTAQSTRALSMNISPPVLFEVGLLEAINRLASKFEKDFGIAVFIESPNASLSKMTQTARVLFYTTVKELFFNVAKHAEATEVRLQLKNETDTLILTVSDDGVGFEPEKIQVGKMGGFGLFSIRERFTSVGGHFQMFSSPGKGSVFQIQAPMNL